MYSQVVDIRTGTQETVHDLTGDCEEFLAGLPGRPEGLLHVFVPHATAGLALIETGSGSDDDLLEVLEQVLPSGLGWRHRHGSPGHGRDHVLPAFLPPFAVLPVLAGRPELGTWQRLCLVDTNRDNPLRKVRLSLIGG
jgi:secondary thiamine-phosphate synthase enzyme